MHKGEKGLCKSGLFEKENMEISSWKMCMKLETRYNNSVCCVAGKLHQLVCHNSCVKSCFSVIPVGPGVRISYPLCHAFCWDTVKEQGQIHLYQTTVPSYQNWITVFFHSQHEDSMGFATSHNPPWLLHSCVDMCSGEIEPWWKENTVLRLWRAWKNWYA